MKQSMYNIRENRPIAPDLWRLVLEGDTSAFTAPGQFADIRLPDFFLRRPISVCDWDGGTVTLIYKLLGEGTRALSRLSPGTALDVLTGLGNGYDITKSGHAPLVVGGGVGIPPLYRLTKDLTVAGAAPTVILGFNRAAEQFYVREFQTLGVQLVVTTADGSAGLRGLVTDGAARVADYTYVFACGPTAMLRALDGVVRTSGQYSFEERMGCGFGACMGCTCQTKNGPKRICKDGPVLEREEVIW